MLLTDTEYLKLANASLDELSKARNVSSVQKTGNMTYLLRSEETAYRIAVGNHIAAAHSAQESLIVITWGNLPMAFMTTPDVGITYFDLRFEIHSRNLSSIAMELKKCLEAQGCIFKEFIAKTATPKEKHGLKLLPGRMLRYINRKLSSRP